MSTALHWRSQKCTVVNWMKFRTLPRAGHITTLRSGRMALVREVSKNPKVTLKELQESCAEVGRPARRTTISTAPHQSSLYSRLAKRKPHFYIANRHFKDIRLEKQDSVVWIKPRLNPQAWMQLQEFNFPFKVLVRKQDVALVSWLLSDRRSADLHSKQNTLLYFFNRRLFPAFIFQLIVFCCNFFFLNVFYLVFMNLALILSLLIPTRWL